MKPRNLWLAGVGILVALAAIGYEYVFVAGAPQLDPPPVNPHTGLTFQVQTFKSQAMGKLRQYGVILPPDYHQNSQKHYPVIFLIHGGHGDARAYQEKAAVTSVLSDLYKRSKLPYSIVITPDGNDQRGTSPLWDSDYYDGPNGKVDTLIGIELVKEVQSRYRTLKLPQFWAMGGQSSGGWGAINIGLRHLNHFQNLFSSSGYFTDQSGPANSPQVFISQIPLQQRQHLHIFLDAGENDHEFLASTRQFHQTLTQLGIDHEFHVFPGGHGIVGADSGWNYWHKHLTDQLTFVGNQFKQGLTQHHP